MQDFYQLFVTELKDMFGSEQQIIKALPTVIKEVRDQKLKAALRHHLNETKAQTKRIKQIADALNINLGRAHCEAMAGILKEGSKLIHQYRSEVKDAAIICSCQRVEHYEIAVYGTLITFAKILKFKNVEKLLKETIDEEINADKKLTEIAKGSFFTEGVNQKANKRKIA